MNRKNKYIKIASISLTSVIILSCMAWLVYSLISKETEEETVYTPINEQEQTIVEVDTIVLRRQTFQKQILCNGRLAAMRRAELMCPKAGDILQSINVKNGQRVAAGTVLAVSDTRDRKVDVEKARRGLEKAKIELQDKLIALGYDGNTKNVPTDILHRAEVTSGYYTAKYALQSAESSLADCRLLAPFSGRIADMQARPHQRGDKLCTLIDDSFFDVEFQILEAELASVSMGTMVKVSPFVDDSMTLSGSVTEMTQITITPDEGRMLSLGITSNDIERAISNNNIVLETLSVRDGICHYSIHFDSQILSTQDIENIYMRHEGRLLQLKDVCHVKESSAMRKGFVTSDGKDAITVAVIKQSDAQMGDLQQSVDTLISQLRKDYPELTLKMTRDQTQLLSFSMHNLEWNLVLGILMAAAVLYIFIGGWRLPTLVAFAIPLSLILTLLFFYLIDISLNIISLSGLILGVGMIVDNAIIVIDNIQQKGQHDETHIVSAVKEVFMPMLSSVLTTCSVFIPLIFLSGTAGALFYDQAMGISTALFCSLAVAALVVPVYYFLCCRNEHVRHGQANEWLTSWYERGLHLTLRNAKRVIVGTAVCLLTAGALLPFLHKERMPQLPHDDALVTIDWNAGITAEESNRRVQGMLTDTRRYIETNTAMVGGQDFILSHTKNMTADEAVCYIKCQSVEGMDSAVSAMREYVTQHYPKAKIETSLAANIFDMIFQTDEPALRIRLQTEEGGRPTVEQVSHTTDSLRKKFPRLSIQPVSTELCLKYNADAGLMAYYKITYQQLYSRMRELLGTNSIYDMTGGGESVPVIIGTGSNDISKLLTSTIRNSDGTDIPLSYLVSETMEEDFKQLHAGEDGDYAVIDIEHATDREVRNIIRYASSLPLNATFDGSYFSSRLMIGELSLVMLVAVLLLYFILAAQFESMLQPAIILIEVVIDIALVLLALYVSGESLNVMSMIGMVVMCGIIINDSILKVDTINRLRRSGMPLLRSVVTAGHKRMKPIAMTSLTTILAIAPFLHKSDMGSALQFPLSFSIIIGMIAGTLVSLFFVPLMYYLIYNRR